MIGTVCRAGRGRQDQLAGCSPRLTHVEAIMRIWRTVLAPAILTIGTAGALVAGPVLALATPAVPVGAAASATPNLTVMHS
jgi:hypothetical protein